MYRHIRKLTTALLAAALILTSLGMGSPSAAKRQLLPG